MTAAIVAADVFVFTDERRFLTLRLLRMCIVEGHIDIRVTNHTLDSLHRYTKGLQLGNISVPTAVG